MVNTKRQKQALATKQKILDTAEELIGKRGYDNVTVDDIVEACGVAKGTFYLYFKSKDELVVYIEHAPYKDLLEEVKQNSNKPFQEKLRHYLMSEFSIMEKYNIHFARQRLRHFADPAYFDAFGESVSQMDIGLSIIQTFIADAVKSGELTSDTPVESLARVIMFAIEGAAIYHCKCENAFKVMEWAETFSNMVFDSILKPYFPEKQ